MVALWLMALVFALCSARYAGAVTVRLDEKDASSTVLLHVGDRLRVELPAAPATAFRWKAKTLDASHLELLSRDTRPDSGRLDASGMQVFVWKAISPGQADVGIEYSRPSDDKTIPPAKRMMIAVEVVGSELVSAPAGADVAADMIAEEPVRIATYKGTLPCEGCTGIAVDLMLFGVPGRPAYTCVGESLIFVERRRYEGVPGGNRTVAGTGTLTVAQGTYADFSMKVYVLAAPDGNVENFKVDGDRLVPLDSQMLPIRFPAGSSYGLRTDYSQGFPPGCESASVP